MAIIIVLLIIVILAVWFISMYNGFIKLQNNCEEAFATMEVYLKKRYDLIPNLVETVKGYAKHEADTLQAVINARNAATSAASVGAKIEGDAQVSGALRSLFAIAEAYPELKANTNYQELMQQLERVEGDIANSRKYYNAVVKQFNIKLQAFPSNIIGSMLHYEKKAMYEVNSDVERETVKVDFGA